MTTDTAFASWQRAQASCKCRLPVTIEREEVRDAPLVTGHWTCRCGSTLKADLDHRGKPRYRCTVPAKASGPHVVLARWRLNDIALRRIRHEVKRMTRDQVDDFSARGCLRCFLRLLDPISIESTSWNGKPGYGWLFTTDEVVAVLAAQRASDDTRLRGQGDA